jgi:hypothetical protein
MADVKITALTALTAADPANDVIPIVDVSDTTMAASGTTKKISVNNILGASGTATLASATITGAATVGTTLGVTGASTHASATITGNLTVQGNGPHRFGTSNYSQFDQSSLQFVGSRATPGALSIYGNGSRLIFQCDTVGYLFQNANNTLTLLSIANDATQLTVNSTGLGVGVAPSLEKLQVNGGIVISPPTTPATLATNGQLTINATSNTNLRFSYRGSDGTTRVANLTLA